MVKHNQVIFTSDEVMHLLVKEEHLELVKAAYLELGIRSYQPSVRTRDEVVFVVGTRDWVIPGYAGQKIYNYDKIAYHKFIHWHNNAQIIMDDFNQVRKVLHTLIEICDDITTMRFIWPTIMGLCSQKLLEKLRDPRAPKALPALHPELKQALEASKLTIAKAMMLLQIETSTNEGTYALLAYQGTSLCAVRHWAEFAGRRFS